jgi:Putative peptidoglycan binding domain
MRVTRTVLAVALGVLALGEVTPLPAAAVPLVPYPAPPPVLGADQEDAVQFVRHHRHHAKASNRTAAVQRALNREGYRVAVDGKNGRGTRAALREFQSRHGLRQTGVADRATLRTLGIG